MTHPKKPSAVLAGQTVRQKPSVLHSASSPPASYDRDGGVVVLPEFAARPDPSAPLLAIVERMCHIRIFLAESDSTGTSLLRIEEEVRLPWLGGLCPLFVKTRWCVRERVGVFVVL